MNVYLLAGAIFVSTLVAAGFGSIVSVGFEQ